MSTPSVHAPNALEPVLGQLRSYLSERVAAGVRFRDGESIQFSWVWFKVVAVGEKLTIRAPRFHAMPMEFIEDCSDCLNLVAQQRYVADSFRAEYGWCNCMQYAIVSRDLGTCRAWFMDRTDAEENRASGWIISAKDSALDAKDPRNFELVSLWELFCRQPRVGEFFLLPPGWQVDLSQHPVVLRDYEPAKPDEGSYFEAKYRA